MREIGTFALQIQPASAASPPRVSIVVSGAADEVGEGLGSGLLTRVRLISELALDRLLAVLARRGFRALNTIGSLDQLAVPPDRPFERAFRALGSGDL